MVVLAAGLILTQSRGGIAAKAFVEVVGIVMSRIHPSELRRREVTRSAPCSR